ncbi:MAG: serine/threonine protein kinase [Proteobacteria bacterium]|nr:serine/threonine protein kinase [Pseudomonadota bacterium]
MTDLLGRIFDRKYRLTRLLDEGGMGTVYEAEHTVIHRKVAVKVMHDEFSSSKEVVSRFVLEAQAASAIGHPNIVEIHDVGREDDGTVFIVMELLSGSSLKDLIVEQEKLPTDFTVFIVLHILSALVAAHEKGIIHRDMKPGNVFLFKDAQGRQVVKLLDFGIAKIQGALLEGDQGLTKTGTVLGTPHYMSPEQARGKPIDARIDVWAVGVMMYEMLSGQLPYTGKSYNEILGEILLESAPSLGEVAPDLNRDLVAIVEKAMAKDRDQRYASAADMIRALLPFGGETTEQMTSSAVEALKSSIAPPPYIEKEAEEPGSKSNSSRASRGKTHVEQRDLKDKITPKPSRRKRSILTRLASLIAVLTILLILIFVSALGIESSKKQGLVLYKKAILFVEDSISYWGGIVAPLPIPDDSVFKESSRQGPDSLEIAKSLHDADPDSALSVAAKEAEDAGHNADASVSAKSDGGTPIDEPPEIVIPSEVTLKVTGLPRRARLTISGKRMKPPITLPGSESPIVMKVTARGYKTFKQSIVPDSNKTIKVSMERKGRRKKRSKRR